MSDQHICYLTCLSLYPLFVSRAEKGTEETVPAPAATSKDPMVQQPVYYLEEEEEEIYIAEPMQEITDGILVLGLYMRI